MLPSTYLKKAIQKNATRLLPLAMIAMILAGTVFVARPAGKVQAVSVTCTSTADGDWGTSGIWDCGHVPASPDNVVVVNQVSLSSDQSAQNLNVGALGVLIFTSPVTLTINGDFNVDALGIFDPGNSVDATGGTVVMGGTGNQTITLNGQTLDFFNLTKVASGSGQALIFDPSGEIHILNNLVLNGNVADTLGLSSTVPGTQWNISPDGPAVPDIDYVAVQDSFNLNSLSPIDVLHGSDLGNNTNWVFENIITSHFYLPLIFNQ